MSNRHVRISKFLSLVLRHNPEHIRLALDERGWASVTDLLAAANASGFPLALEELQAVVRTNDKQRFAFSADDSRIRASQGHSVRVELGYAPAVPPDVLYHGTAERFVSSIKEQGLIKGRRHHVHLSQDTTTAKTVGQRYGKPVVLAIKTGRMHEDGFPFFHSTNGVWLTEHVPPAYIEFDFSETAPPTA